MAEANEHQPGGEPGSSDPFSRYVLPELDVLARVAFSLTRNGADAEDLVQETLLCAYRAIERFDGAHPRAWLFTIMRNAEAKRHRRRRPQLLRDPDQAQRLEAADPRSLVDSPEQVVLGAEFDAVVAQCLLSLPERHRQVVELVDVDGLSYAEAAEAIGIPVGTVMSRLHRARARIRQRLSAAGLAPKRSMR
ncbi:MAG: sigma-70 family RNA polymerase sigma factor [Acidimicrobiales bacterium]